MRGNSHPERRGSGGGSLQCDGAFSKVYGEADSRAGGDSEKTCGGAEKDALKV